MGDSLATIVITPREQFSKARCSLESILQCTEPSVPILYVDANSPPPVAHCIREQAARRGFTVLHTGRYLCANEARNIALPHVRSKYVAFVDNDVSVTPGWLEKLVACAEETGAWAVGPLYFIDDPAKQIIHMAGGELKIVEERGARRLHERHRFSNVPLGNVREHLVRQRTDIVEFHCMLVRKDVFDRTGMLDEELLSFLDHVDFCLAIAQAGGSVFIEPSAIVTHLAPPPYAWYDLPYFLLRWSDAWMEQSARRFADKHGLATSDPQIEGHRRFRNGHRLRLFRNVRTMLLPLLRNRGVAAIQAVLTALVFDRLLERTLVASLERRRRSAHET
jgi:glycosyltransferase involved in cell wall biosynthesis